MGNSGSSQLSGEGKGKLLLFGEHSAVYGYPALGVSLPFGTRIFCSDRPPDRARPMPETVGKALEHALSRITRSLSDTGVRALSPSKPFSYISVLPMGSGFGSSAAACVALTRLLAPPGTPEHIIWQAANSGEAVFHGTPSGIDTGLALGGGLFALQPRAGDIPRRRKLDANGFFIVAGTIPREKSTRDLIESLAEQHRMHPGTTDTALNQLGEITRDAIRLLDEPGSGSPAIKLGKLARNSQKSLKNLGFSTEPMEKILLIARENGSLGEKLSGAGGGGAFFALTDNTGTAETIRRRWDTIPGCLTIAPFTVNEDRTIPAMPSLDTDH